MLRGFTGDYYNGHPVFIRKDYNDAHLNESEKEKLEELLGCYFETLNTAVMNAYNKDRSLLYKRYEEELDRRLRHGLFGDELWHPYKDGFVHEITGEYIPNILTKPIRDSWPCWALLPYSYQGIGLTDILVGMVAVLVLADEIKSIVKR